MCVCVCAVCVCMCVCVLCVCVGMGTRLINRTQVSSSVQFRNMLLNCKDGIVCIYFLQVFPIFDTLEV